MSRRRRERRRLARLRAKQTKKLAKQTVEQVKKPDDSDPRAILLRYWQRIARFIYRPNVESKPSTTAKIVAIIGVVGVLLPWGLSLIGVAINLYLGGIILFAAFALLVWAFWIWEKPLRFHVTLRAGTIVLAALIYFGFVGKQMIKEYQLEHPKTSEQKSAPLPVSVFPRFVHFTPTGHEQYTFAVRNSSGDDLFSVVTEINVPNNAPSSQFKFDAEHQVIFQNALVSCPRNK